MAGQDTIAVLPLGAHEQHGPHLPFETDTLIARGIAARLAALVPAGMDVRLLETEPVGYSIEHMDVEGTKTLAYDEAVARWLAIAAGQNSLGIRKLLLLNAHGGNAPLLTIVATEARIRFNMLVVATSWTRFGVPEGFMSPADKAIDIHAGDIETSVMLALARLDFWPVEPSLSSRRMTSSPRASYCSFRGLSCADSLSRLILMSAICSRSSPTLSSAYGSGCSGLFTMCFLFQNRL